VRLAQTEATNIRNRSTVVLERSEESGLEPIKLTIYALPPTYADDAEAEIPSPNPPFKGLSRNKKGRLDKDDQNRPIKVYDEQDPQFLKDESRARHLQSVKMVVDALDPSEMGFETQKDEQDPSGYYAAVFQEMTDYGFSMGDFLALVKAVATVSNMEPRSSPSTRCRNPGG